MIRILISTIVMALMIGCRCENSESIEDSQLAPVTVIAKPYMGALIYKFVDGDNVCYYGKYHGLSCVRIK